jgi:hypothetical protein
MTKEGWCRRRGAFERIAEFGADCDLRDGPHRLPSSCVKRSARAFDQRGEGVTAGTACMGMDRISQVLRPGPVSPEPGADAFCYEK